MSHLSSTMQRIADEETTDLAPLQPLPGIASTVSFRLRGNEFRNGSNIFAALVTRVHADRGLLDLVVVFGADDFMDQREVPCATEESGWGWSPVEESGALASFKEELAAVLFGPHQKAEESVYDVLIELEGRIEALEAAKATPKARLVALEGKAAKSKGKRR